MEDKKITMPAVALRGLTILPGMVQHFDISREKSIRAIETAMMGNQKVYLVTQRHPEQETPAVADLYQMGTISQIKQLVKMPGGIIRVMVEGDKIVKDSRSKNGYDSHLTVKYQVGDRADKKPMFDIRRGKPKGAAGRRKEKAAAEKKDLASIAADWLADLGLNADVKEDELLVHGENGVWRIVVDKPGRGKRFSLKNKLFELMTQMDENVEKYSIVVMRDAAYLRDWKRLSAAAKQKINLSLLLCSANGHVKEYE